MRKNEVWSRLKSLYSNGEKPRAKWRSTKEDMLNEIDEIIKARKRRMSQDLQDEIKHGFRFRYRISDREFNEILQKKQYMILLHRIVKHGYVGLTQMKARQFYNHIFNAGPYILRTVSYKHNRRTPMTNYITINNTSRDWFIDVLTSGIKREANAYESDAVYNVYIDNIIDIALMPLKAKKPVQNKDGRFFPKFNNSPIDLSKYQIFYEDQIPRDVEHCLIYTLKSYDISPDLINAIKLSHKTGVNIRKTDLPTIAKIINRCIKLFYYDKLGKLRCDKINKTCDDVIEIAMHSNHYFKNEPTIYTKYSINNLKDVFEIENFNNILRANSRKTGFVYGDGAKITSLMLVNILDENNWFNKGDMTKLNEKVGVNDEDVYLTSIENEQRPIKKKKKKDQNSIKKWVADCENFVYREDGVHELAMIGVSELTENCNVQILDVMSERYKNIFNHNNTNNENYEFKIRQYMVNDFLNIITGGGKHNALVYFHNVKYDYMGVLEPFINVYLRCEKNGQIYNICGKWKSANVELRDSYKLISEPLSKFSEIFDCKELNKMDVINYEYFKPQNYNQIITVEEYCELLDSKKRKAFLESKKLGDKFNPWGLYREYLNIDCLLLKTGLIKFEKCIGLITKKQCSIYDSLTISSLTYNYILTRGCFDGVYEVCGNLRAYIAKAVYGGRVHANEKYVKKVIEGRIGDYDANSLYPSAMVRICETGGIPKGEAKRFNENIETWRDKFYSILTVRINKVRKEQQMPFIANRGKETLNYTNNAEDKIMVIDSLTLEDYIKYHDIEYELIDGVYWNNGGNKELGTVMRELFEKRKSVKKDNPSLGNAIKLMMNSAYGKTITKKVKEAKIIKQSYSSDKLNSYICNNFNTIKSYREINQWNTEITHVKSDMSYNQGHIGCLILSMSKRIMNEVFDVANENNIPIYYQDTDSIHLNIEDVEKIEQEYYKRHERVLTGGDMGQFHVDFDFKGSVGEIYAEKSIFLGKKSYIDCMVSTNEKGEIIRENHVRLKGITKAGINHAAKKFITEGQSNGHLGLYEYLAKSKPYEFVLNPFDKETKEKKAIFRFQCGGVRTMKENEFKRLVEF